FDRCAEKVIDRGHESFLLLCPDQPAASFASADRTKKAAFRHAIGRLSLMTALRFSSAKSQMPITTHQIGSPQATEAASRPTPLHLPPNGQIFAWGHSVGQLIAVEAAMDSRRSRQHRTELDSEVVSPRLLSLEQFDQGRPCRFTG